MANRSKCARSKTAACFKSISIVSSLGNSRNLRYIFEQLLLVSLLSLVEIAFRQGISSKRFKNDSIGAVTFCGTAL